MSDQNKLKILGIDVIRPEVEEAVKRSLGFVKDPGPSMVYFLTAESSLLCQNDAGAADYVNRCDLVLPGDLYTEKVFSEMQEGTGLNENDGQYAGNYMNRLFALMDSNELSIYAVMNSEETLTGLQEYILTNYPGINLDGILVEKDSEGEFGRVVNDINACVPDIVFICLPPEMQIRFAEGFSQMMNTGLCICIESMQPWLHRETVEVPAFFKTLKAEKLYLWMKKKGKLRKLITGSIFRKRVLNDAGESPAEPAKELPENPIEEFSDENARMAEVSGDEEAKIKGDSDD